MSSDRQGLLFIVSAPSGTGKTTVVERLVEKIPDLQLSRSYTSRPPREGEVDRVDYNFISRQRFEAMRDDGQFLEWADVFGNLYGTGAAETRGALEAGKDVVLVIDVQGARKVRQCGLDHVDVFILPPSFEILERRLRRRSQDAEAQIQRRLEVAQEEVGAVTEYEYVVINDDVEAAVARLSAIVEAERASLRIMRPRADAIISSFRRGRGIPRDEMDQQIRSNP
jgi:guanylate kinase